MITDYDEALEEFDVTMMGVYNSEVERLAAEKEYLEYLAMNSGKPKGYFKVPVFHGKRKSTKRIKDLKMSKEWNKSIKLGRPRAGAANSQSLNKTTNFMRQRTRKQGGIASSSSPTQRIYGYASNS